MNLYSVLQLLAGLSFFLYGMSVMSSSLEKMAGGALEENMKKVTSNALLSFCLGALITIGIQSSSGVMVMLVGLVNSGIISYKQTIPIILGSNVGTTVTGWILTLSGIENSSFNIMTLLSPEVLSPVLAFVGMILRMTAKKEKQKDTGTIFIGFAVLMYGMSFMSGAMKSVSSEPWFSDVLMMFTNPFLAFVVATLFTGIIQSSAATIGIIEAFTVGGGLTLQATIPLVLGANVGTCITAMISSIGTGKNARKVSLMALLIKSINALIVLIVEVVLIAMGTNSGLLRSVNAVEVAVVHTTFNIFATVLSSIFSKQIIYVADKIVGFDEEEIPAMYLDDLLLSTPNVAVNEAYGNTMVMGMLAREEAQKALNIFLNYDEEVFKSINETEKMLDKYEDELGSYLVKLSKLELSVESSEEVSKMLHVITDFERIGDHAVNIANNAKNNFETKNYFSAPAIKEVENLTNALNEILSYAIDAYNFNDVALATRVEPLEEVIDSITENMMNSHINRLVKGECTIENGFSLSDLLNDCERISDHCSNIGVCVIEVDNDNFHTHKYLRQTKRESREFRKLYKEYEKKYIPEGDN